MKPIKHIVIFSISLILLLSMSSCDDSPVFPVEPRIEYVDIFPREVVQGEADSVFVTFRFQDGDGDLGALDDTTTNLILLDSRYSEGRIPREALARNTFTIPSLTPDAKNPSIQGEITVKVTFLLVLPDVPQGARDSVRYQLLFTDRAGNLAGPISGNEGAVWTDYVYISRR